MGKFKLKPIHYHTCDVCGETYACVRTDPQPHHVFDNRHWCHGCRWDAAHKAAAGNLMVVIGAGWSGISAPAGAERPVVRY